MFGCGSGCTDGFGVHSSCPVKNGDTQPLTGLLSKNIMQDALEWLISEAS